MTCRYCGNRMIDVDIPPFDLMGRGIPARFCETCKNTEPSHIPDDKQEVITLVKELEKANEELGRQDAKLIVFEHDFSYLNNVLTLYKKAFALACEDANHWRKVHKVCQLEEEYFLAQAEKELNAPIVEKVVPPAPKDKCHHCGHEEDFEWHSHGREAYCNKCGRRQ